MGNIVNISGQAIMGVRGAEPRNGRKFVNKSIEICHVKLKKLYHFTKTS